MKILLGTILVVLIGGGVYLSTRSDSSTPMANESTPEQAETETDPETATQAQLGAYVDYSETVIDSTKGTKILFFHASWCPQCRTLESSIKSSQIPDGVTIIKVDYDSHQKLRQQYGVTIQTTLVKVDDDGKLIKKYVAYDEPTFAAVKTNLL